MKTLFSFAVFIFISAAAFSQDLRGQWNGSLHVQGTELNLAFHVAKPDDVYKSTMDSPDQNVKDIIVTTTTFNSPNVRFEISSIGAVYEGVMSNDQATITGKWMQSGATLPLILEKNKVP